ncbi:MAG: hypothetical protein V4689_03990 [Verrucomicrobiota bacterium]
MPLRFSVILLLAAASVSSAFAETRSWKSADGVRTIQGDFVKRDATTVTIRLESGKESTIELTKLHADETKWLNANHSLAGAGNGEPDPAAVFDTLLFGDSREVVEKKLKASKIVELTTDEAFLGRSGLNGVFFTRQKIGKVKASLYFDWTETGKLKELTLQTELLPDTAYKSDLEPTWAAMVELLSTLYGKPVQKGPMPTMASLGDGTFFPSHLWELEGGGAALLGTAREGKKYQLVVRFTQTKIQPVEIP